jgi:phosphotransacetylase/acyl dehydratase
MSFIENRTFDEINIGDSASVSRTLTQKDIDLFAILSGDVNPAHVDEEFARSDMFHHVIAHGMWGGALISAVMGTQLPGPGAIYLGQSLRFRHPVCLGDTVAIMVRVTEKVPEKNRVTLDCQVTNQRGEVVISGTAEVLAPTEKIKRERVILPEVKLLEKGRHLRGLLTKTHAWAPIRTAVVHPVSASTLLGAMEAAKAELILPTLVGAGAKIRAAAEQAGVDISNFELVYAEHSHAAAELAVSLAREHKVDAIMKGSLATDELMHFVDAAEGLRTNRRISHAYAVDVPTFPRLLFISDASLNLYPTLVQKRDIVQNVIDLACAIGTENPKVGILSSQKTVSPDLPATLDAAVLSKMAERGQITGGRLDGPLGFDVCVSLEAAKEKGVASVVAGRADILVVPDLEAGDMLVQQLKQFADAQLASLVLGARVPIILPERPENTLAVLSSCALALMLSRYKQTRTLDTISREIVSLV